MRRGLEGHTGECLPETEHDEGSRACEGGTLSAPVPAPTAPRGGVSAALDEGWQMRARDLAGRSWLHRDQSSTRSSSPDRLDTSGSSLCQGHPRSEWHDASLIVISLDDRKVESEANQRFFACAQSALHCCICRSSRPAGCLDGRSDLTTENQVSH